MTTFSRRIGDVYVKATRHEDGSATVLTTDAFYRPVDGKARRDALQAMLDELSAMREHIYFEELGNPRSPPGKQVDPKR